MKLSFSLFLLAVAPCIAAEAGNVVARLGRLPGLSRGHEVAVQTEPASEEKISFVWDTAGDEGLLIAPTVTTPGRYVATLKWRDESNVTHQVKREFTVVAPGALPAGVHPVVLLNGFQFPDSLLDLIIHGTCPISQTTPRSRGTFGEMESVLNSEGFPVVFFDNCAECRGGTIEECGAALGRFLERYPTEDGQPVEWADLVGHSMGGLIARSYLAGKRHEGGFAPPEPHRVRKLVLLATPNFGSYRSVDLAFVSPQLPEMLPGSDFVMDLGRWNGGRDDLRGVDALALVGNGCRFQGQDNASDGLVTTMSASIGFAVGPERTRVLAYRHNDAVAAFCPELPSLAKADGPAHEPARAVVSFLSDTDEWRRIGWPADEDWVLLRVGAAILEPRPGTTRVLSGAGVEWKKSPSGKYFYAEAHPAELTDIWSEGPWGWTRDELRIQGGYTQVLSLISPEAPGRQSEQPAGSRPSRERE